MKRTRKARAPKPVASTPRYVPSKVFPVRSLAGATPAEQARQIASDLTAPEASATRVIVAAEGKSVAGEWLDVPGTLAELRRVATNTTAGDLSHAEAMLMNQAQALQSLFTRLIERGVVQESLPQYEAHMRLALKAQAQSRATLETLANVRNGPVIYARQANVAAGAPMQVNNGAPAHTGARQIENPPNQLLEPSDDCLDDRTQSGAGACDPPMEAVGAKHRAKNIRR
ncbi:hypothetical protein [Candidatus Viadribacter manganicus]|uniref:Uncharacterized protein n=1 Tax=Candidatus Viadribacter manganicus TaxID=1759059 RepID=A0A1B1AD30_9PROT|nr:hypothetical protein [Candidatus Viadribacter manganicus]ANP44467.1 hypothetical protein ATE48_00285 [Candidatus Viadribacter manganicus]